MKSILICHFGEPWESLAASSLLKAIPRHYNEETAISLATSSENSALFVHNKQINRIFTDYDKILDRFDVIYNLTPTLRACSYISDISADVKTGFVENDGAIFPTNPGAEESYRVLKENLLTDRNVFQVIFRIANMKWKGEGYDLAYYPKAKTKRNKTGIAIADENLRLFVKSNLNLGLSEIWHIPLKQNILKRIDEINRCKNIVTDDLFTLHVSIALRKHVEFLDTRSFNMNIEFFGNGTRHKLYFSGNEN